MYLAALGPGRIARIFKGHTIPYTQIILASSLQMREVKEGYLLITTITPTSTNLPPPSHNKHIGNTQMVMPKAVTPAKFKANTNRLINGTNMTRRIHIIFTTMEASKDTCGLHRTRWSAA